MRKRLVCWCLCLVMFGGAAWADQLLTIGRRETDTSRTYESGYRRGLITGRAKERLLDVRREKSFGLPKAALAAGTVDTITIIGIRVDFSFESPDDPLTTGKGIFDLRDTATFLAEEGHALDPAPHNQHYFEAHLRALSRFWEVVSNGKLKLVYEVWPKESDSAYHVNETISHYGAQEPAYGLGEFFHDALNAASAAEGDTLAFRDDRGMRKAVIIFHAGSDRQSDLWFSPTTTPRDLYTGFLTFDGPNRWFQDPDTTIVGPDTTIIGRDTLVEGIIMPETMYQDNRVTVMNAVMAHEFGHQLGLVDLYNTGSSPFMTQVGDFSLMDNMGMNTAAYIGDYGVGVFGTVPVFPDAWSRAYLGFDDVVEYRTGTAIEVAAAKMLTSGTKIVKIPITSAEYYLLENRRADVDGPVGLRQDSTSNVILGPARRDPIGDTIINLREYDLYLPQGSAGIAVWHIDESVAGMDYFPFDDIDNNFDANTLQWDRHRRFLSLVEADGIIDLGGNYYRGFGQPQDLFYAGNNAAFGTYTNPATISHDGAYTHINVTNVSQPGSVMTFDLNQGRMAPNFPRRISIPSDPSLPPVAADLDGDGTDEIIAVSGRRILAVTADGRNYIDPIGVWDADPKNQDTIYSAIQSTTDANSDKPIDTSYAFMPVFAVAPDGITTAPVVATFNDTTLILVGFANGWIESFLPYDSIFGGRNVPNDGRAQLFKLRATSSAGSVKAIVPDETNNIIHVFFAGGKLVSASWDASGPIAAITHDFGADVIGVCRYRDGMAVLCSDESNSILFRTRDVPLDQTDSLVVDSVMISDFGFHAPLATDFDRDGVDEIVLISRLGRILAFRFELGSVASYEPLYDLNTGDTAAAGGAIGDLSGDGFPELVVPGTNRLYGFDRHGVVVTDFPLVADYGRPGQVVVTPPVISDITGDGTPDAVVAVFDSLLLKKTVAAYYVVYPDTINYPDSFIVVDTTLDYYLYNYYSTVHVLSAGMRRVENFPVSAGALGIRYPGDTVMGVGSALHVKTATGGLLVTTGADGWLNAWECGWTDKSAWWPMGGRTPDGSAYLPLEALGEEKVYSDFLPEKMFYNYPNPVRGGKTWIRYYVNQPASVTVTILDALGDEVWEVRQEVTDGNSQMEIPWDVGNVASGVYHCRLEAVAHSGSTSKVAFKTIAVVK